MKIVVLAGGISTEREVSLVSGTGVCRALRKNGHRAILVDLFLGLEVYSRTDMILDESGKLWVLEANSLPGMTPTSFVPKEAAAVGISYEQLCQRIVDLSMQIKRRG